jgi:hypothetical protein
LRKIREACHHLLVRNSWHDLSMRPVDSEISAPESIATEADSYVFPLFLRDCSAERPCFFASARNYLFLLPLPEMSMQYSISCNVAEECGLETSGSRHQKFGLLWCGGWYSGVGCGVRMMVWLCVAQGLIKIVGYKAHEMICTRRRQPYNLSPIVDLSISCRPPRFMILHKVYINNYW